uniref:Uncharacterized protein n=1 Tax=Oryza meridionalis TaxID=40149 RepID=A0A0E0C0A0_9ORYZ
MASCINGGELQVRVVSRRLVQASDESLRPHVLAVSNLDLLPQTIQVSMFCIYPKPPTSAGRRFPRRRRGLRRRLAVVAQPLLPARRPHRHQPGLRPPGDPLLQPRPTLARPTAAAISMTSSRPSPPALPSLLNHFFPLAGRIVTSPCSGLPEIHCHNQGAELVVGEADVALASLDYGAVRASVGKILLPYAGDVALSVQVVSFACGGFTVAWGTNHVLVDGSALSMLVGAWSELARSGALAAGRSTAEPRPLRVPPTRRAVEFTPLDDGERQVNVLTSDESFVARLYYIDAAEIARLREAASRDGGALAARVQAVSAYLWKALATAVGARDERCRMVWWVDGRRRLTSSPELRAAMRNYVGNVVTFALVEATPLPEVVSMVRHAITEPAYDERFQELVDWVEEHKTKRYMETVCIGLGSPSVSVTAFASFAYTDFGFGHAAMALPTSSSHASRCTGFVQIAARPGGDGSWIVSALVWPRLAAALESGEVLGRIFKPVTAEYLGLRPATARPAKWEGMITSKI